MAFFSYRTKHKSPAGNQFWKFSRQCSIFVRNGDQWVAISNPEYPYSPTEVTGISWGWEALYGQKF